MTIAQHILVFTGFILALAVGDLAISFHRLMIARARVRWYWPVLALALFQLLGLIQVFWMQFYLYAPVKSLTIMAFLPDVALQIVLFLMTAAVLPDEVPNEGIDLRDYYWTTNRYFWSLVALLYVGIFIFLAPRTTSAGATPVDFVLQWWTNFASLLMAVVLIATRREWVHKGGIVALTLLAIYAYVGQAIM